MSNQSSLLKSEF